MSVSIELKNEIDKGTIVLYVNDGVEMVRIESNGDFYVKGKKTANDIDVFNGFKKFIEDIQGKNNGASVTKFFS